MEALAAGQQEDLQRRMRAAGVTAGLDLDLVSLAGAEGVDGGATRRADKGMTRELQGQRAIMRLRLVGARVRTAAVAVAGNARVLARPRAPITEWWVTPAPSDLSPSLASRYSPQSRAEFALLPAGKGAAAELADALGLWRVPQLTAGFTRVAVEDRTSAAEVARLDGQMPLLPPGVSLRLGLDGRYYLEGAGRLGPVVPDGALREAEKAVQSGVWRRTGADRDGDGRHEGEDEDRSEGEGVLVVTLHPSGHDDEVMA